MTRPDGQEGGTSQSMPQGRPADRKGREAVRQPGVRRPKRSSSRVPSRGAQARSPRVQARPSMGIRAEQALVSNPRVQVRPRAQEGNTTSFDRQALFDETHGPANLAAINYDLNERQKKLESEQRRAQVRREILEAEIAQMRARAKKQKAVIACLLVCFLFALFFAIRSIRNFKRPLDSPVGVLGDGLPSHPAMAEASRTTKASESRNVLPPGTDLEGIELDGKGLDETREILAENQNRLLKDKKITVFFDDKDFDIPLTKLNPEIDYEQTYKNLMANPGSSKIQTSFIADPTKLKEEVEAICAATGSNSTGLRATSFNPQTMSFSFAEGDAEVIDEEKLITQIEATLKTGALGEKLIPATKTLPSEKVHNQDVQVALIGKASTQVTYNDPGRDKNLERAAALVNGKIINPGEVFSFLQTMGEFTEANGFYPAGMQANGVDIKGMAGGICQASTTLFQACVRANLVFPEHHNHDVPSNYCKLGEDAMVADWADLKIQNNSDYPVALFGGFEGVTMHFEVYGKAFDPGVTIDFAAEHNGYVEPPADQVIEDPSLPPGTQQVDRKRTVGQTTSLYRIFFLNGVPQSKEFVCKNYYPAFNAVIRQNTKAAPAESAPSDPSGTTSSSYGWGSPSEPYSPFPGNNSSPEWGTPTRSPWDNMPDPNRTPLTP